MWRIAITGATGFVGRAVARALLADGSSVRALVRRPDSQLANMPVELIPGSIEDFPSLERLVEGMDAVVHCAGLVRARRARHYFAVNAEGTRRLAEAVSRQGGGTRLLSLSSIAAREPGLSAYAASKYQAEKELQAFKGRFDYCSLRPPAVYGPGDRATLPIIRQLTRGLAAIPAKPDNRFSLIYVEDLANAVTHLLARPAWRGAVIECDDKWPGGYNWAQLAKLAGMQMERPVKILHLPHAALWLPAALGSAILPLLGRAPVLSPGKLREMYHPDWVSRPDPEGLLCDWNAQFQFQEGLAQTILWYQKQNWL